MSIPKVQTAAVVSRPGAPIEIRNDYPVKQADELGPGECLIQMQCSGVCHTGTSAGDLVVLVLDLIHSSRSARQERRLAYIRCHVRAHFIAGDFHILTFHKSPYRWSRRCR